MTNQDVYAAENKNKDSKFHKSNEEETKSSNRKTSMCDQYFSSSINQRVSKESDNILSKTGESNLFVLTGEHT